MERINAERLWRQIPPEEKFELIAKAHAKGLLVCLICITIASTLAIGLQLGWIMWGSLILSPFVFQFAAGKEWRGLRPLRMLEYMAARAAARRYAYTFNSRDLTLRVILRGQLEFIYEGEAQMAQALEAEFEKRRIIDVWIVLFTDCVVLMSERPGGAQLEFAHLLNDKLGMDGISPDGQSDYSNGREIYLTYAGKHDEQHRLKITSRYPAALIVFEKRLEQLKSTYTTTANVLNEAPEVATLDPEELDTQPNLFL
ncbi:MAG: hypothetical protein KDD42_07100 [Bdellovibrionales bacterium]|nr:hypothetical protein [Bdellovibrionales bacterium]